MSGILKTIIDIFLNIREAVGSLIAPKLLIFQLLSLVISGVLVWLIIYSVSRSGWLTKRIEQWMDFYGSGDVGKRRQLRAWNQIIKRMKTPDPSNWKVAILEADNLMDDILKSAGYRFDTADERFKNIKPEELSNADQILEAHRVRNRIAQEPDFTLTKEEALGILRVYKKSFQEFGLLD